MHQTFAEAGRRRECVTAFRLVSARIESEIWQKLLKHHKTSVNANLPHRGGGMGDQDPYTTGCGFLNTRGRRVQRVRLERAASEARKVEGKSCAILLAPRPPDFTVSIAWVQVMLSRLILVVSLMMNLRMSSHF